MKFGDLYNRGRPIISFELFPPKTDNGMQTLEGRLPKLIDLKPDLLTVTYGAMGSTRARTLEVASKIKNEYGADVAHHFTCVGLSRSEIADSLDVIQGHNIENVVALRGDPPRGEKSFTPPPDGYRNASDLVEYIAAKHDFGIAFFEKVTRLWN